MQLLEKKKKKKKKTNKLNREGSDKPKRNKNFLLKLEQQFEKKTK